jgi:hypothetical protein
LKKKLVLGSLFTSEWDNSQSEMLRFGEQPSWPFSQASSLGNSSRVFDRIRRLTDCYWNQIARDQISTRVVVTI